MRSTLHRLLWLSAFFLVVAHAQGVPSSLEPWRGWVWRGQEFRACPLLAGKRGATVDEYVCAWPGALDIAADASGATVAQRWHLEADAWIALPGDADNWPQQVTVDGQPVPVVDRGGPSLRLAPGNHEIRARIPWQQRPETLRVPSSVGIVTLAVDGKPVTPVQRSDQVLTLGRGTASAPEADAIELRVYRKLADGIPALLTTQIRIGASGQGREETFGPVLPVGFEPLRIDSTEWPARIDGDGRLHVQAQPGETTITLQARAVAPLEKVVARVPAAPWPQQEIWSYEAAPTIRVTVASSALQVDPRQASVDEAWRALPAFALDDGGVLAIEQRSRGLADDEKNRLTLDREMWLDFAGDGWFARDHIGGEMLRGWRFDVASPLLLERAEAPHAQVAGREGENLLVTRGMQPETTGVEWRTPAVDLAAGIRIASASTTLPVAGWQDSFDHVTTTLHLPSGYKLLAAPGADEAAGSWFSAWTLLDVFVAAIVVLLAGRLFGLVGAATSAGYLVLAYQESGAPLWTLLAALALGLIARALPNGKLADVARWLRIAALALLVLVALPFAAAQLRYALHPQLESGVITSDDGIANVTLAGGGAEKPKGIFGHRASRQQERVDAAAAAPPPLAEPVPERGLDANQKLETITVTGSNIRRVDIIDHYAESTVVQSGAGEPHWNVGEEYVLSWSGPVVPSQNMHLVIAPPWLVRALRVALVALLAFLLVRLARTMSFAPIGRGAAAGVAGIFVWALAATSPPANAQAFPPENLLNELRSQMLETPACVPNCAVVAKADVVARGDEIRVALEAHAATRIALPVAVDNDALTLRSATVDGTAQEGLARAGAAVHIALARGVHRVELVYAVGADKVALAFPYRPMRIEFTGDGWQASGINENRLLTETLSLTRVREAGSVAAGGAQQFAPFVRVEREITLGLNWSMHTTVRRLAPKDGGFTVSVPALPGEHVTTAGVKSEGGQIIAAIADSQRDVEWESTLDKTDTFALTAPPLTDRAEVWRVTASPIWHLESSGVPVAPDVSEDKSDFRRFEFDPLPGETLTLHVVKPTAAEGSTRAIDRASLVLSAGQRASDATLDLSMRATQGGEQSITLPRDAEVMNVTRNGETLNVRPREGALSLPLVPGTQQFQIRFRQPTPVALVTRTPAIAFGLPAANVDLGIDLPTGRWLLITSGPAQGPAVLYWSELAVMLIIAWALARTRRSPLSVWQWMLLGVGFSTFSWLALLLVVAWLFALDWRARGVAPKAPLVFNFAQIGLAALTIAALLCLAAAIPQGLLGTPDMHVEGHGSSAQVLRWFADRSADALPAASAISLPLWVYKLAMLAWAIWLANAVVGWLRYGFAAWLRDGYWRALPRKALVDVPTVAPPPSTKTQ